MISAQNSLLLSWYACSWTRCDWCKA